MRAGMGNLLETDSDVASVSDNERERTDGDGMESDSMLDTNKNATSVEASSSTSSISGKDTSGSTPTDSSIAKDNAANLNVVLPQDVLSPHAGASKSMTVSPRELPPRSQLIQLKPTLSKPRLTSRNSAEFGDGANKQKNPRFIPYEPYRGAVRPIVAQQDKKHSRTGSDASVSSLTLEQTMNNISLLESGSINEEQYQQSVGIKTNTHKRTLTADAIPSVTGSNMNIQIKKQKQTIEKQTNALTLLKERLKIAEKDNHDLHKENIRLKKLLVDSLSGDYLPGRADFSNDSIRNSAATNESVDALSNEIEVWRSKFLSSCVLVEQLTRENGALHDAVGSGVNIFKEIKLSSSLSEEHFEQVNAWLRQNRGVTPLTNNNVGGAT